MKPIREWSLVWFWWLAIGLAVAARLAETAICAAFACIVPGWLSALTDILAILAVFVVFGLRAVIWRLE